MNNKILLAGLIFSSSLKSDSVVLPTKDLDLDSVPSIATLRKHRFESILQPETQKPKVKQITNQSKIYLQDLRKVINDDYDHPELVKRTVTISLKNTPVSESIELISKLTGISFVVDSDVVGKVKNINLKDVPVVQVLKIILSNNVPELALKKEYGIFRIMLMNKAINTIKYRYDEISQSDYHKSQVTLQSVAFTEAVKQRIKRMWRGITCEEYTKHGIYIVFDDESKKIFFRGRKQHISDMREFLKDIDVALPQVKIEARVVIAKKDFDESLGLQISGEYNRRTSSTVGLSHIGSSEKNKEGLVDWALNLFPDAGLISRSLKLPFVFGGNSSAKRLNLVLSAAENRGELKTILKPSILTNHGQESKLSVGDSVPIQTVIKENIDGAIRDVTTASYKDIGTILKVTPNVSPDKKNITLDIYVENSSHVQQNKFPLISSARTKCKVMLKNGQTAMIGGLIEKTKKKNKSAVPILSEIPIIGNLFKGMHRVEKDHQLLVFITPTIV